MGGLAIMGAAVVGYSVAHVFSHLHHPGPGRAADHLRRRHGRFPRRLAQCHPPTQPRPQQAGQDHRPTRRRHRLCRGFGRLAEGRHPSFVHPLQLVGVALGKVGWVIFAVLLIVGTANAVNLTDGLDGLAAGSSVFTFVTFTVIGFYQLRHEVMYSNPASLDEAVMAAALIGACAGFLWWNAAPARIFMGDTGSLGIGAAVAVLALLENVDLLLPVIGGLYRPGDAVGHNPGRQFPPVRPPGFPHGAGAPPLRAAGVAGDDGDRPVLDPGRVVHGLVLGRLLRRLPGPRGTA